MKAVVVYDSTFGNTAKIALAIVNGLEAGASVERVQVQEAALDQMVKADLLVVGSPTRGFRPTEAITALLARLDHGVLAGVRVAAFDTRFNPDEMKSKAAGFIVKTGGFAARRIAARLTKAGGVLAAEPEGFFVEDTEGPLAPGELERATEWAKGLLVREPA